METTETNGLITAEMASVLTKKKAITIEAICENIKRDADIGMNSHRIINLPIPNEVMSTLLKLGYSINQITDPYGNDVFRISW